MKSIFRIALIASIWLIPALTLNAQDSTRTCKHHCHWKACDSTGMERFCCAMHRFDKSDFPFKHKKDKYNGHWAGFDLGIGGYLTPDFDMNFSPAHPYMNLNTARSLTVNINPFELNVNLAKKKLGFTTGLGLQVSNYYFTGNYIMIPDSSKLVAYRALDMNGQPASMKTNKMVVTYVTLPVLFEFQTNPHNRLNSFHVSLGAIAGVRIGSHTKQVYNDKGESYYLADESGKNLKTYEVDRYTVKERDPYHLNPFKLDAAFRIGWSHLNLFGTYSLTQMFQKDQGPELYPFTVGLSLVGW